MAIILVVQVNGTYPTIVIVLRIDEATVMDVQPHLILGAVITGIELEQLNIFIEIKHPPFLGTESKDTFEFIINCYERLHKTGVG